MASDELCSRVNYDVGSVLNRTEDDWSEGVVNDDYYIVLVSNFCNSIKVGHVAVWVAEGLDIHGFRVRTDSSLQCSEVVHVDDGVANTLSGECMCDEVVRTTIQVVCCHDVIAVLCDVLQGICDSCGT